MNAKFTFGVLYECSFEPRSIESQIPTPKDAAAVSFRPLGTRHTQTAYQSGVPLHRFARLALPSKSRRPRPIACGAFTPNFGTFQPSNLETHSHNPGTFHPTWNTPSLQISHLTTWNTWNTWNNRNVKH